MNRWLFFNLFAALGFGIEICKHTVVGGRELAGYGGSGNDVGVSRCCRSDAWESRHCPLRKNRPGPIVHGSLLVVWCRGGAAHQSLSGIIPIVFIRVRSLSVIKGICQRSICI